ncbi:hypothetical protein ACS0TY_003672 [Phlomoides rotata]
MDARAAEHGTEKLRNRNEKGRRGWSVREEQVLSEAMKQIVREGWRTENGFKTGYLKVLYTYMKHVLPDTDLKPEPHITSRITVWKKNYHSLFEILKHTGVGLDSTTKMVEATDEQWSGFMKRDPNARLMRHKSWPMYEDWCEIFGYSRATGDGAESHNFCDGASSRLGEIAQRIGHDHDMSSTRKLIYSSVSKMNMLTLQEKLRVTALIARHNEHIDVFFSLPDDDRMEWVLMVLNGDI